MRRTLAIVVLCLALAGCSAQRRAERKVRRAVELCPELVQLKAHPIDTVFTLAALPDSCRVPIVALRQDAPLAIRVAHGTFTAHADTAEISIAYFPDTLSYRYTDTVWLPQVVVAEPAPPAKRKIHWGACAFWAVLVAALLRGIIKDTCPD